MCAAIGGKVAGGTGGAVPTNAPTVAADSVNQTPPPSAPTGPTPLPIPGATDLAGILLKRKLNTLKTGILSTVSTNLSGIGSGPQLSTPTAGGKTALGQ